MSRAERLRALRLLEEKPHREIYEGGGEGGKGSGKFYVTYNDGGPSPELDREDIRMLLAEGNIKPGKYEGVYVLA